VVFDGRYGEAGHRRQRYRCYPEGRPGGSYHRFTDTLPRQVTVAGVCEECERGVHVSEGPPTPRQYEFAARDVARALVAVLRGQTYKAAAAEVRRRSDRFPLRPDGRRHYSRHGQLVGDWVEVFAPVIYDRERRTSWPQTGSLVLDHLGFRVRGYDEHGRPKTGPVAFNVLAALGYEDGHWQLWRLASSPTVNAADWAAFLSGLDGAPRRVVTDGHSGTIAAVRTLWPEAELYRSDWHLKQALQDELVRAKQHGNTRLQRALDRAFINRYFWEHFCVVAHRFGGKRVNDWIDRYEHIVIDQFGRRSTDPKRKLGNPTTTAVLEPRLEQVKAWVTPRAHALRNRDRFDLLLMLMQLQLNEQANEATYARYARDWLLCHGGRPIVPRRAVTDDRDNPSLYSPAARRELGL
jgi:hypothetical protein